ncbi:MAG: sugar ABC transporter ATP-binding protein [Clostridiales bacterium]|nr:sugar ABC transporter ATP-binding protein [Clostridiales bacterium]
MNHKFVSENKQYNENVLEICDVEKVFGETKALNKVNLSIKKGEIRALVGENGAGKSTLINILCGIYSHHKYTGKIFLEGKECKFKKVKDSEDVGISVVHQEFTLIPQMSIAENVFLGNEKHKNFIIDWKLTKNKAKEILDRVGLKENGETSVKDIGIGKQQLTEIAKALNKKVKVLILDEPTAALNEEDSNNLFNLLLKFKETGITSILVSHKLEEVMKIADSVTILRDGKVIETLVKGIDEISRNRLISGMVGRKVEYYFPKKNSNTDCVDCNVFYEIKNWNVKHHNIKDKYVVKNLNMYIKKNEIVGIAGLAGSGRTEFAMSLFGKLYGRDISGSVYKNGKEIYINSVSDAINNGLAYVSEDRKNYGLDLSDNVKRNISIVNLSKICTKSKIIDERKEKEIANYYKQIFNIKTNSIECETRKLSGGNQQKVVLSKWIFSNPDLLILDEPTRGIDVATKHEIYTFMNNLVKQGKSIIMISSEMTEILGMSDRIYVMNSGKIVGEFYNSEVSQEIIMECIVKTS